MSCILSLRIADIPNGSSRRTSTLKRAVTVDSLFAEHGAGALILTFHTQGETVLNGFAARSIRHDRT